MQLPDHLLLVSSETHDSGIPQIVSRVGCIRFCSCEMMHSASSRNPLEPSNQGSNPIRIEKRPPFFSLLLVADATRLVPRVLCRPGGGRMKVDRRILAGSAPANLNLGLCHVTIEQKQTQGRVHSGEPPNGMSTKFAKRMKHVRESCGSCCIDPVVA
jgi:hypothetical protein